MKERFLFIGVFVLLLAVMVGLNAASYVQRIKEPDKEIAPNRSTYNPGSTGLLAYYMLLVETGHSVKRWQRPMAELPTAGNDRPDTFVLVGPFRKSFTSEDHQKILEWVSTGGRLVLIDREPPSDLVTTTADWSISLSSSPAADILFADPSDQKQMTAGTAAVKPDQVTLLTARVNAVQPSKYASSISLVHHDAVPETEDDVESYEDPGYEEEAGHTTTGGEGMEPTIKVKEDSETSEPYDFFGGADPTPSPASADTPETLPAEEGSVEEGDAGDELTFSAPVVHLSDGGRIVLADIPYGQGRIIVLSDPFIVSNGGISMADNAQLAINLAGTGPVLFDEYHHGYGAENNRFFEYFAGTPVTAIFLQVAAVLGLILYSRSRRFARPVPEPDPDRLSKLEYIGAMAELQQKTRAYDLAMENIYYDFRRRVCRYLGLDNMTVKTEELAAAVAERAAIDRDTAVKMMAACQDIVHGERTNKKEMLMLTTWLRETEEKLRLTRRRITRI